MYWLDFLPIAGKRREEEGNAGWTEGFGGIATQTTRLSSFLFRKGNREGLYSSIYVKNPKQGSCLFHMSGLYA